jgi:AcrR family transcriptional regulator
MAAQVGLDWHTVVETAAELADTDGLDSLTLAALAGRLGVRSQSLYAHVDGLDGLQRDLALHGVLLLGAELRSAVIGRSGRDALRIIGETYLSFAERHPGLYAATIRDSSDDEELHDANLNAAEALMRVIESFGLHGSDVVHAHRAIWSAIHGFVTIQQAGAMRLAAPPAETFHRMLAVFADALEDEGGALRPPRRTTRRR